MQQKKQLYRQGDVMFIRRPKSPSGDRKVRKDGIVMHGEATGHAHRIADLASAEVYDVGDGAFLSVSADGGVSIVHDEHLPIDLPKGDYEIRIQREYSPEGLRSVID